MRRGEDTTATAQREDITTITIRTEAQREHRTMISTGTTGDTATGTETEREKHKNTMVGGIGGIVREIDTPTTTGAGPIPVPDLDLL